MKRTTDVPEIRALMSKVALGMLSTILLPLLIWAGKMLWASKLDVATYNEDHAQLAQRTQIDSLRLVHIERQVFTLACTTHPASPECRRPSRGH